MENKIKTLILVLTAFIFGFGLNYSLVKNKPIVDVVPAAKTYEEGYQVGVADTKQMFFNSDLGKAIFQPAETKSIRGVIISTSTDTIVVKNSRLKSPFETEVSEPLDLTFSISPDTQIVRYSGKPAKGSPLDASTYVVEEEKASIEDLKISKFVHVETAEDIISDKANLAKKITIELE